MKQGADIGIGSDGLPLIISEADKHVDKLIRSEEVSTAFDGERSLKTWLRWTESANESSFSKISVVRQSLFYYTDAVDSTLYVSNAGE